MKKRKTKKQKKKAYAAVLNRSYFERVLEYDKQIFGKKTNLICLFMLPVVFAYYEILLRVFSRKISFLTLGYPILFGASIGFLVAGLLGLCNKKVERLGIKLSLYITALLFTVECVIKGSFQHYMTISMMLAETGDVMGSYKSELVQSILGAIPVILLFFGPAIFYTIFERKIVSDKKFRNIVSIELIVIAALLFLVSIFFVNIGKSKEKYKEQYEFNLATEVFGLFTSTRLNGKYAILGNSGASSFDVSLEDEEEQEELLQNADTSSVLIKPRGNNGKEVLKNAVILSDSGQDKLITLDENGKGIFNPTCPVTRVEYLLGAAGEPIIYGRNKMDINFKKLAKKEKNAAYKELDTYVASLKSSEQNKYTGIFKGKNLILICAEAFSDAAIHEELTPTLYRLAHKGFYFSNFYQPQWGGSTSTGEYSLVMGLVPMNSARSIVDAKDNNNYFTLGNQLQRQGYYSAAYHNGTNTYYKRHLTHENLGYSKFIAYGSGLEDVTTEMWAGDEPFLDETVSTYIDKEPFSIYYMTISGHFPYKHGNSKVKKYGEQVKKVLGDKYKQTTLDYYCYQMELEAGLTKMIEKLDEAGILNDTVICMTADHNPYGLTKSSTYGTDQDYLSDLYGYKPDTPWGRDRNACILWSGCLENEYKDLACEISEPAYSLDIVPTLSNLFGLEYDSRLLVGRDVFSDAEPLVLWPDHSWMTKEGSYNASTGKYYVNDGYKKSEKHIEKTSQAVSNKLKYSKDVIKVDYFGKLFGEDTDK